MIYKLKDILDDKGYIRGPFGSALKRNEMLNEGIPVYEQQNAINENRDFRYYINEEKYEKLKRFTVKENDLIVSCSGTVGKVSIIRNNDRIGIISQALLILRPNIKIVLPEFLYYFLKSNKGYNSIVSRSSGSVQVNIAKRQVIEEIEIEIPTLEEQRGIIQVLSDIDKKIETNNKINKKLEEIAQVIFKQWFVDFEFPCISENYKFSGAGKPSDFDKVCTYKRVGGLPIPDGHSWFVYVLLCEDETFYKGMTNDLYRRFYEHYTGIGAEWTKVHKPIKVIHYEKFNTQEEARKREEELKSGFGREWIKRQYEKYKKCLDTQEMSAGLPAHKTTNNSSFMTAGEMVESELGMIPLRWHFVELGEISEIQNGFAFKASEYEDSGIKVMRTLNINDDGYFINDNIVYLPESYNDEKYKKYILKEFDIALVMVGASIGKVGIVFENTENSLQNQNMWRFRTKCNNIPQLFLNYKVREAQKISQNWGTGSAREFYRKDSFSKIKVLVGDDIILREFNDIISTIFKKISILQSENEKLKYTRDTLLPKLMSGEIRVPLNNEYN